MTTELERLARANPVLDAPEVDAEAQLRAIVATPRERPRRRVRRRLVPALALACALAAALAVALPGGPAPTLVERAYAQVSAGDDVVHEVVISSWTVGGKPRGSERIETWYRPSTGQAHRKVTGDEGAVEVVVTRDGGVLVASADTERRTGRPGLQPIDAGNAFRDRNRRDLAATFREAVDAKTVTDRGRTTFDGLPAQRFEVTPGSKASTPSTGTSTPGAAGRWARSSASATRSAPSGWSATTSSSRRAPRSPRSADAEAAAAGLR